MDFTVFFKILILLTKVGGETGIKSKNKKNKKMYITIPSSKELIIAYEIWKKSRF